VFRVFIAVHLLKKLYFQWPSLGTLYGPDTFAVLGDGLLSQFFDIASIQALHRPLALGFVGTLVLYALGIGKHVTALGVFAFLELFQRLNGYVLNGGDNLLKFCVLYMVFADSYRHLSLTPLVLRSEALRRWSALGSRLAVGSTVAHLSLVYLVAGLHKINADEWFHGVATYYTLLLERFEGTPMNASMARNLYLITLSTYATALWEVGFCFMIWNRRGRLWVLAVGLMLHAGIYVFMMIYDFQAVFVAAYVLFVDDAQWRRGWARMRALAGGARLALRARLEGTARESGLTTTR
jgi:hypothetical protein